MSGGIRHFLQFADFNRAELEWVFERSRIIKDRFKRYQFYQPLADRTLAMVFEKASTRTRVSFEAGMYQMGGSVIHITTGRFAVGPCRTDRRHCASHFADGRHRDDPHLRASEAERFAAHSRVPVINGLTNEYHPCQILADIFTFIEHRGPIAGRTVAWIGDANNMAYTWLQAARSLGFRLNVSTPPGYALDASRATAGEHLQVFADPMEAARGADLVTTDVWTSMGYEAENEARTKAFTDWQVDTEMMQAAGATQYSCTACPRIAARKWQKM